MLLKPKNWEKFQHYKDRSPPWVKLHKSLLDDRVFMRLPLASKALAPLLWLLASESKTGEFDASIDELEFRLRISGDDIKQGLKPLIDNGFFVIAGGVLADCLQVAVPETEREAETEQRSPQASPPTNLGSRLSTDWELPDQWQQWAQNERPDLDVSMVADSFKDFWIAKPGKDGRKSDWQATWRNWVRNQRAGQVKATTSMSNLFAMGR